MSYESGAFETRLNVSQRKTVLGRTKNPADDLLDKIAALQPENDERPRQKDIDQLRATVDDVKRECNDSIPTIQSPSANQPDAVCDTPLPQSASPINQRFSSEDLNMTDSGPSKSIKQRTVDTDHSDSSEIISCSL